MPEFRKRRTRAEVLVRVSGLIAGTCLLGVLAFFGITAAWHMYIKLQDATDESNAAASELSLLQKQETQVQSDITGLSSARGTEAALRERYGVIKPGEGVIQIVEPALSATSSADASSQNIFARVFNTLFGW